MSARTVSAPQVAPTGTSENCWFVTPVAVYWLLVHWRISATPASKRPGQGRAPGCRPGPDPVLVQLLPARRQTWFFLVARSVAESQVHWWTSAPTSVEIPLTSTHLPLCTATSW